MGAARVYHVSDLKTREQTWRRSQKSMRHSIA
jgi:hypothetical protein